MFGKMLETCRTLPAEAGGPCGPGHANSGGAILALARRAMQRRGGRRSCGDETEDKQQSDEQVRGKVECVVQLGIFRRIMVLRGARDVAGVLGRSALP